MTFATLRQCFVVLLYKVLGESRGWKVIDVLRITESPLNDVDLSHPR